MEKIGQFARWVLVKICYLNAHGLTILKHKYVFSVSNEVFTWFTHFWNISMFGINASDCACEVH